MVVQSVLATDPPGFQAGAPLSEPLDHGADAGCRPQQFTGAGRDSALAAPARSTSMERAAGIAPATPGWRPGVYLSTPHPHGVATECCPPVLTLATSSSPVELPPRDGGTGGTLTPVSRVATAHLDPRSQCHGWQSGDRTHRVRGNNSLPPPRWTSANAYRHGVLTPDLQVENLMSFH